MTFPQAMRQMMGGKSVTRRAWRGYGRLMLLRMNIPPNGGVDRNRPPAIRAVLGDDVFPYTAWLRDIIATDWEIAE